MTKALVPLADGVEEMEAVIIIDTLRRARWEVVSAGTTGDVITASRQVRLVPDIRWPDAELNRFDALIIPGGGPGTEALCTDQRILDAVRHFAAAGKLLGAICAGPLVLQAAGVLAGRIATCHPAVRHKLTAPTRLDDRVATDGRIVTSQGPGTAFAFALALVEMLDGPDLAAEIAGDLVL